MPTSHEARDPSRLQILANSEIFRLGFIGLYPNCEEDLFATNFLAPLRILVRKKREILPELLRLLSCLVDLVKTLRRASFES